MIGERLREARVARGLSLGDVASKMDVSTSTLSRIENGKQGLDFGLFLQIVKILRVNPGEVIDGEGASTLAGSLGARLAAMPARERTKVWREMTAAKKKGRNARAETLDAASVVDELLAQLEFLRGELETLRARVRRRR